MDTAKSICIDEFRTEPEKSKTIGTDIKIDSEIKTVSEVKSDSKEKPNGEGKPDIKTKTDSKGKPDKEVHPDNEENTYKESQENRNISGELVENNFKEIHHLGGNASVEQEQEHNSYEDKEEENVETDLNNPDNGAADIDTGPTNSLQNVPIDKGWAWVTLAGCILYALIFGGVIRTFGVFFLQFQERFHAKAAEVALMSLIQNIIVSITGLLVMTIGLKKLSCRTVVAVGGGLNALSHIISGFATDIRVFYFSHGLFGGAGMAMISPPLFSVLGVYFKKHRGLANSMYVGSASIGGLIFAPVFTTLFEEYGYTGTMLIVGGLLCNTFVTASLLRSPAWFSKRHLHTTVKEASEKLLLEHACSVEHANRMKSKSLQIMNLELGDKHLQKCKGDMNKATINNLYRPHSYHPDLQASPLIARARSWSQGHEHKNSVKKEHTILNISNTIHKSKCSLYASAELVPGSLSLVSVHSYVSDEREVERHPPNSYTKTCCSSIKESVKDILSTVFDLKMLRNAVFIQYISMSFVTIAGMALVPVYLPPLAKDAGISYDNIAIMLSAMACLDFISKIVSGVISDRKWIKPTTILGVAALATGTMCHVARFFTTLPLIITMAVILACFYGLYGSMYAVILIECIGQEKFQSSLGFVTMVHGFSVAIFFPISGMLRDVYESYIYSLHMCGVLAYIGAALLFTLPMVQKKLSKREQTAT